MSYRVVCWAYLLSYKQFNFMLDKAIEMYHSIAILLHLTNFFFYTNFCSAFVSQSLELNRFSFHIRKYSYDQHIPSTILVLMCEEKFKDVNTFKNKILENCFCKYFSRVSVYILIVQYRFSFSTQCPLVNKIYSPVQFLRVSLSIVFAL